MMAPVHERTDAGSRWLALLGAPIGLAWFVASVGTHTLDPTALGWLGGGDHAAHLLGWLFFRHEEWTLPLGTIRGLAHPIGTTLGFTDANPWVALLLKPLAPWLPADFQFIGPWLALCFALQGIFGIAIVGAFTPRVVHRVLGGTLFVLAPPLLHRLGHDTLCAHWLLLALIWLHVRRGGSTRSTLSWAFVLNVIAAGVHPYLAAMLVVLTLALFVRMYMASQLGATTAVGLSAAIVMQTLGALAALGYLTRGAGLAQHGFGVYASDLLALFNSRGYSRWVPPLPSREDGGEGFGYLGIGVLGLAAAAVSLHAWRRHWPRVPRAYLPLLGAAGAMGVFALSNQVSAAGHVVLTLRGAYEPFLALVEPFRSSGRFIWPVYYVVLTGVVAAAVRRGIARPMTSGALLLAAVVAQAAEVPGVPGTRVPPAEWPRVEAPEWEAIGPPLRHLILYPPFFISPVPGCRTSPFDWREVIQLSDLAYRRGLTINSAYISRPLSADLGRHCQTLEAEVAAGRFASDAIYVLPPDTGVAPMAHGALACDTLDGFRVCANRDTAFGAVLDARARRSRAITSPGIVMPSP
jgi:hypothetical protein